MENENSSCCRGKGLLALGLILVAAIVIVAILRDRIVNPPQWQVSVAGQGKVAYQPDIVNVTLGVQIDKEKTAQQALSQLNQTVKKVVAALKTAGVPETNVQTQNYSLFPQYDYTNGASILSGYNANQQLVVKVEGIKDDMDKVSKVIKAATDAGINQVLNINFDVSNLEELKQQARILAIGDAKNKAGATADAAGVKLGKLIGWWENVVQAPTAGGYYADGKGGAGGAVSPTLPNGLQEVIIEISLNYKVK